MALEFPSNPTNGQVFDDYFWDASIGAWRGIGSPNNLGVQVGQLRTASPITVANQAGRDALYPAPVEGNSVFRDDLGVVETYYAAFNAVSNPGGRDTAGWYAATKTDGQVPVIPTAVTYVSGSGSVSSLGAVSFTNVTSIQLDNVFTTRFSHYKVVLTGIRGGASGAFIVYAKLGTTGNFPNSGYQGGFNGIESGFTATANLAGGDGVYLGYVTGTGFPFLVDLTIAYPNVNTTTSFISQTQGWSTGNATSYYYGSSRTSAASQFTHLQLLTNGGTMTGTAQVFGYNDK